MARHFSIAASALVLLFLTIAVDAQQTAQPNAGSEPLIRKEFRHSPELPEGIAFLSTMQFLASVNESSSDAAGGFVKEGMGLDGIEAEEFLALLLTTFESVEAEVNRKKHEVCLSRAPKNEPQVYATFIALENVTEHVAAVRLHRLRAEIGADRAKRLDHWLDAQKLKIEYVRYNRKEQYKIERRDPYERLEVICSHLARTQRGEGCSDNRGCPDATTSDI